MRVTAFAALMAAASQAEAGPATTLPIEPIQRSVASTEPEAASRLVVYYHDGVDTEAKQVGISLPSGPVTISGSKRDYTVVENNAVPVPVSGFARPVHVTLPVQMTMSEARAYAAEIEDDPDVKAVLIDQRVGRHGITSTDTLASLLWNLEGQDAGTTHTEPVWPNGKGTGVTVAVLDTGRVEHPDMSGVWVGGYDLISSSALAGDGDGRDNDPTDIMSCESDGITVSASPHGLMVGSVIGARLNNGTGIAGVAPDVQIMPVRVISGCGGYLSDVLDGMRWAVGLQVAGLPLNPNPAKILNLSLGTTNAESICSAATQLIVDEVKATGATIIVSTGNDGTDHISIPAACQGVIAVTASTIDGKRADYGNAGVGTTLAAAGGGCASDASANCALTANNFIAVASHDGSSSGYVMSAGTSFSAPHVTGVAALLLERNSSRTADDIESALVNSARAFSSGACDGGLCGAGMLDTDQALAFSGYSLTASTSDGLIRAGQTATITAHISEDALGPTFEWRQLAGQGVTLNVAADGRSASFVAPASRQSLEFEVEASDQSATKRVASVMVQVTVMPELASPGAIFLSPGEALRKAVLLVSGAAPEAMRIDAASSDLGFAVQGNELVWDTPVLGSYPVELTPYDSVGAGITTTVTVEVSVAESASSVSDGGGGGGAVGLHGGLLLLLAWFLRRRLYANS